MTRSDPSPETESDERFSPPEYFLPEPTKEEKSAMVKRFLNTCDSYESGLILRKAFAKTLEKGSSKTWEYGKGCEPDGGM